MSISCEASTRSARWLVTLCLAFVAVLSMNGGFVASVVATPIPGECFGQAPTISGSGVISGTDGDDVIAGSDGVDIVDGGGGNDLICGGAGEDVLLGGAGEDLIAGGSDNDAIDGQDGNDELIGDESDDLLLGSVGDDVLDGGEGNDVLHGDTGVNTLSGGNGSDWLNGGGQLSTCEPSDDDRMVACVDVAKAEFFPDATSDEIEGSDRNEACLLIGDVLETTGGSAFAYDCGQGATPEPNEADDLTSDDGENAEDDSTLGTDDARDDGGDEDSAGDDVVGEDDEIVDDDLSDDEPEEDGSNPDV